MTGRVGPLLRALLALAGIAALAVGLPAALVRLVGWPLPRTLPSWDAVASAFAVGYIPDTVIVNTLAVLCWIFWAPFTAGLAVETAAAHRGHAAARIPLSGLPQRLAAKLVAAAAAVVLTAPSRASAAPPLPPAAALAASIEPDADTSQPPQPQPAATGPTHTVRRYDDLWSIAERRLGDPYRWPEIWDLNQHRRFPDGRAFTDPDLIHPGWELRLPADATDPDGTCPPPPAESEPPTPADAAPNARSAAPSAERPLRPTPAPPSSGGAGRVTPEPDDPPEQEEDPEPPPPALVELPSGAVVGLTLAAAVSGALARARLHRRRRRRPGDPDSDEIFTEALETDAVRQLRRADLAHRRAAAGDGRPVDPDGPPPPAEHPGTVTLAERDGRPIPLDLTALGGLCITGPPAAAAARAVLADFLGTRQDWLTEVLIAGPGLAADLTGQPPPIPDLDIAEDLKAALDRLEAELIARTRLLEDADAADFPALADTHPQEPTPALLLITHPPEPLLAPRLEHVLAGGRRLGVSALILGPHPSLPCITVDAAAHVTAVHHDDDLPDLHDARLCTLSREEAAETLAALSASRGLDPQPEPEPQPESQPLAPEPEPEPKPQPEPEHEPEPAGDQPSDDQPEPSSGQPTAGAAPITVYALGPLRIEAAGAEIRAGLRTKARELLAYVALHPTGVTAEAAIDALWPNADPKSGDDQFRTTLGNLRSVLRKAAALSEHDMIIDRVPPPCRIDPELVDSDLARFHAALEEAATADDDHTAVDALQRAAACYRGALLENVHDQWVHPLRRALARRAVDALARLADLREKTGDLERALNASEQAITHDPYAEALYQRSMRLQAALARPDAVHRTYQLLETRLAELDESPHPTTTHLHDQLLKDGTGS